MTQNHMPSYVAGVLDSNARIYPDVISMRLLSPGMGKDFKHTFGGHISRGRWRLHGISERRALLTLWAERTRYRKNEVEEALDRLSPTTEPNRLDYFGLGL